jgi:membrane protein implicated in regulation of membrane protease activity
MAFLCTFAGLLAALIIWVGLYTLASESRTPLLIALAPYLEAFNPVGQGLFAILAVTIALLIYRLLKPKAGNEPSDRRDG